MNDRCVLRWTSLFSYAYTYEMSFAPLQTSTREGDSVDNSDVERQQPCSPRAMYSLAVVVRPFNAFTLPSPDLLEARDHKYQGRRIEGYPM